MTHKAFGQDTVNTSKFHMIRCLIAMAHADGKVIADEHDYLENIFKHIPLTSEQQQTILNDLGSPQNPEDLFKKIDDPAFKGQLIYFARLLAYADGDFAPDEETLLKRMRLHALQELDMEEIRECVHENVSKRMIIHDVATNSGRPAKGLGWLIDQVLITFGIDLMD